MWTHIQFEENAVLSQSQENLYTMSNQSHQSITLCQVHVIFHPIPKQPPSQLFLTLSLTHPYLVKYTSLHHSHLPSFTSPYNSLSLSHFPIQFQAKQRELPRPSFQVRERICVAHFPHPKISHLSHPFPISTIKEEHKDVGVPTDRRDQPVGAY